MKKTILFLLCLIAVPGLAWQQKPMLGQQVNWADPLAKGVVGYWPMNERAGGIVTDLSGNRIDLTFGGTPIWEPGEFGNTVLFDDASSEYAEVDKCSITALPFTMICWFKSDSITLAQGLMWMGDSSSIKEMWSLYAAGTTAGDPIGFRVRTETPPGTEDIIYTTTGYSANTLHMAAGVVDAAGNMAVYLDASGKATGSTSGVLPTYNRTAIAAFRDASPGFYLSGSIELALLYNRALTAAEVRQLYQRGGDPLGMNRGWGPMMYVGAPVPVFQNHYRRMRN